MNADKHGFKISAISTMGLDKNASFAFLSNVFPCHSEQVREFSPAKEARPARNPNNLIFQITFSKIRVSASSEEQIPYE